MCPPSPFNTNLFPPQTRIISIISIRTETHTHHIRFLGGRQCSLLTAVTPRASCITVMYFW